MNIIVSLSAETWLKDSFKPQKYQNFVAASFGLTIFVLHIPQSAYVPHALAFKQAYTIKVLTCSHHTGS